MLELLLTRADDPKQAVRLRRFLLASSFSLLYLFVLFIFFLLDKVGLDTIMDAGQAIAFLIFVFYGVFRTGLNLRVADPSLTAEQLMAAILTMLFVLYRAPHTRLAFSSFFFIAFMFGMLRLPTRKLAILGAISLAAFAFVVWLRYTAGANDEVLRLDMLQWAVLTLTLPWFLLIGEYVKRLRKGLADISTRLEDIEEQARHDELTGVFNRRALMAAMQEAKQRADATGQVFSLCIIDIDHFKRVNDEIGHLAGDDVLRRFARGVQEGLRSTDIFGRYGGEEFIQILPHTSLDGAMGDAERLRKRAEELDLTAFGKAGSMTVSIGVAQYRPGETVMQTFSRADAALYSAKMMGRNRVASRD